MPVDHAPGSAASANNIQASQPRQESARQDLGVDDGVAVEFAAFSVGRWHSRESQGLFATRDDLEEMLTTFQTEFTAATANTTNATVGNFLRKYDEKIQRRFVNIESDHEELVARVLALDAGLRQQGAFLTQTNREIATFSTQEPAAVLRDEAWDRQPDATILSLSAAALVA